MRKIYLDYAATAPVCGAARVAAIAAMDNFGNPSSVHAMGLAAEKEVIVAREAIAHAINAKPSEIYFTASGTEANNLAILGGAKLPVGVGIVTSPAEHSSIKNPVLALEQRGFKVFHVEHSSDGSVNQDSLRAVLSTSPPVSLVSIHHVQNETGVIQDIAALVKIVKDLCPKALFHVDAVQSFCKIPVDVRVLGVDLLSISAHKIGGLKGCGALFVREKVHVSPIIFGGGQENGLRSGTENVVGIAALGATTKERFERIKENFEYVRGLKKQFYEAVKDLGSIEINGQNTSPYILNISVADIRPEVLLNALSAEGVYISAGAACSSNKRQKRDEGAVLTAYGLSDERAQTAMRISFSPENTLDEIAIAADIFVGCVKNLRKMKRLR
ncbi:MAG: cysteine desulfurase [Defluviitaleaceae bacterium]|nr:cysteine desulfurase [Defluviitaleaceae bacterium]